MPPPSGSGHTTLAHCDAVGRRRPPHRTCSGHPRTQENAVPRHDVDGRETPGSSPGAATTRRESGTASPHRHARTCSGYPRLAASRCGPGRPPDQVRGRSMTRGESGTASPHRRARPPDQVRGVPGIHVLQHRGVGGERTSRWRDVGTRKTPGSSPGAGTTKWRVGDRREIQAGQPWTRSGHPRLAASRCGPGADEPAEGRVCPRAGPMPRGRFRGRGGGLREGVLAAGWGAGR